RAAAAFAPTCGEKPRPGSRRRTGFSGTRARGRPAVEPSAVGVVIDHRGRRAMMADVLEDIDDSGAHLARAAQRRRELPARPGGLAPRYGQMTRRGCNSPVMAVAARCACAGEAGSGRGEQALCDAVAQASRTPRLDYSPSTASTAHPRRGKGGQSRPEP